MVTAVQQLGEDVAKAAASPLWPLGDDELTGWLRAARHIEQAAVVLQARLVRQAVRRGVPGSLRYRSSATWLRSTLLLDIGQARDLAEGAAKTGRWPQIEQAVLDGRMDWRQARVIADAVAAIPAELAEVHDADSGRSRGLRDTDHAGALKIDADSALVGRPDRQPHQVEDARFNSDSPAEGARRNAAGTETPVGAGPDFDEANPTAAEILGEAGIDAVDVVGIATQAERVMIGMADRLTANQLTRIGDRILSHVAPELADRADQVWLTRQETRAHQRRTLTLSTPIDGMVRLTGVLSAEDAATVNAALNPLCTPTPGDDRTPGQRRTDALIDICRLALRTGELPDQAGQPAQLSITVPYQPLTRSLGIGTTDTGERLSAETVRRLACDAKILPHVLGGAGQILDVGRARRLATAPLRRALTVRDGGCAFPDCDRPPGWTDAHHIAGWSRGGPTNLVNLVLLCRMHHRLIHDHAAGWRIQTAATGIPEFIPPPHLDPRQRPRRNLYHQRE